ncbi:MAG: regulatory signaling modulator protein AmpE, partial [Gammaproteobacteria bacterium]|nr:regulatory signaling modulator protein AmpE [Gammaproteobacteria bacterium]
EKLYKQMASQSWRNGPFGVMIIVGLVISGVWLIDAMLNGVAGVFSFVFGLAVLIYCLGPKDLLDDVHQFTDALQDEDKDNANRSASEILGMDVDDEPENLATQVRESIVITANIRVFGVIFWFMILGPVGAALFRMACLLKRHPSIHNNDFNSVTDRLYDIMLWPSARLTVIGFALTGSFVDTISNWRNGTDFWQRGSEELLVVSANGAIRHEQDTEADESTVRIDSINNVLALVKRTLIVWLATLALMTLAGWIL